MSKSRYVEMDGYLVRVPGRPGRPALPPEQRKVPTSVTLTASDIAYLESVGSGSRSAGVVALIRFHREAKESALAAIKAAAERRDQSTVQDSAFD